MNKLLLLLVLFIFGCNTSSKPSIEDLNDLRRSVNAETEKNNAKEIRFSNLADSLYTSSNNNYPATINFIDSVIKFDQTVDKFILSDLTTLKGDIHYIHNNFSSAKQEYSKLGGLYRILPPKRLVKKAAVHIKLHEYDSAYIDLRKSCINTSNYWYLGNYFEVINQKDSAVKYYNILYIEDSVYNKFCSDRILYLQKKDAKYFTELFFIDY